MMFHWFLMRPCVRTLPAGKAAGIAGLEQSRGARIPVKHEEEPFPRMPPFHSSFPSANFLDISPFWMSADSGLLTIDLFFLQRFHEADSFRADPLARTNFFFLNFHEARELSVERCDFGLVFFDELFWGRTHTNIFQDELWTDVFFPDEALFFWDESFLQRSDFWGDPFKRDWRGLCFFFHPDPVKQTFGWSWRLLITQLPENCGFVWREVTLVLRAGHWRFSLWWYGAWSEGTFRSEVRTLSGVNVQ